MTAYFMLGLVHTNCKASTISANRTKVQYITSSLSNRGKIRW